MLVTLWWWLIWDVGGRIIMLATFFVMLMILYWICYQHPKSITNISNLSPTHLVYNIRHQHRCYRITMCRAGSFLIKLLLGISIKIYGIYESDRFVCVLLHVQIPDLSELACCSKIQSFVLVFILKMHILWLSSIILI